MTVKITILLLGLALSLAWISLPANAQDTPCITIDDEPIPFKAYFRERNHIIPELQHGIWDHFYQEEITPSAMERLPDTVADYQDCLAKHLFKGQKKK